MLLRPAQAMGVIALAATAAFAQATQDYAAGQRAYARGDVRAAIAALRPAADAGHAKAQVLLGSILAGGDRDAEAAGYLRRAAEQGEPDGLYLYAAKLAGGEGVERDPVAARAWMEKAANAGKREAVVALADAYLRGGFGLTEKDRDSPAALAWMQRAAELNHLAAIERLARAFRRGEYGLAADERAAAGYEARARELRGATDAARTPSPRRPTAPKVPGA